MKRSDLVICKIKASSCGYVLYSNEWNSSQTSWSVRLYSGAVAICTDVPAATMETSAATRVESAAARPVVKFLADRICKRLRCLFLPLGPAWHSCHKRHSGNLDSFGSNHAIRKLSSPKSPPRKSKFSPHRRPAGIYPLHPQFPARASCSHRLPATKQPPPSTLDPSPPIKRSAKPFQQPFKNPSSTTETTLPADPKRQKQHYLRDLVKPYFN
jgi:hypothetical protein